MRIDLDHRKRPVCRHRAENRQTDRVIAADRQWPGVRTQDGLHELLNCTETRIQIEGIDRCIANICNVAQVERCDLRAVIDFAYQAGHFANLRRPVARTAAKG